MHILKRQGLLATCSYTKAKNRFKKTEKYFIEFGNLKHDILLISNIATAEIKRKHN